MLVTTKSALINPNVEATAIADAEIFLRSSRDVDHLKVHKNENFLAPIYKFVFFRS